MTRPDDRLPAALLDLGPVPADRPLPSVLRQVADLAGDVLGAEPAVSVTVVGSEGPSTVGASSPAAVDLDLVQYRTGGGPCLEAVTTGRLHTVDDAPVEDRWPDLAAAAAAQVLRAVVSVPYPSAEPVAGGLDVYLPRPLRGDPGRRARAERFARHAAVTVANAHLYRRAVEQADDLQLALESRGVIGQAKGILMERFRLTAAQAFDALARVSDRTNTKLRDVAVAVVETGEFPPS